MATKPPSQVVFALPEWLPHPGGLATFYVQLAQGLASHGVSITVLTAQETVDASSLPGVTVVNLIDEKNQAMVRLMQKLPPGWSLSAMSLALGWVFRRWVENFAPSDCLVFAPEFLGYASLLTGGNLPPLIVTAHGSMGQIHSMDDYRNAPPDWEFVAGLESESLLRAAAATAYSPLNAADWSAHLPREVSFVPPCFACGEGQARPRSTADTLQAVVVGRLQSWKGAIELAEALAETSDTAIRAQWFGADTNTAPDGSSMAAYLERRYPEVWGSRLIWRGAMAREVVWQAQAEADFAIVPSRWDTLNFTAIEAMAQGTPVLVSNGAGASFLIEDGHNGFTFQKHDAQSLARALQRLAALPPREREAVGQRGRLACQSALAPDQVGESYLNLSLGAPQATAYAGNSAAWRLTEALMEAADAPSAMQRLKSRLMPRQK